MNYEVEKMVLTSISILKIFAYTATIFNPSYKNLYTVTQ